ncbi:MAG: alpha/beta hydrolase [Pseudomonadota bacterium]
MKTWQFSLLAAAMFVISACAAKTDAVPAQDEPPAPAIMTWADLVSRPLPAPTATVSYGDNAAHLIDVWVPDGEGPHPIVLMVHGGCWQKAIADRTLMNYAAEDLRQRGLAVWNIEYRGVDEAGGGYPGTFEDVAAAADFIIPAAPQFNLDVGRIAGFGHSAGGHLVAWLAARENLPDDSALAASYPLSLIGIVISGGLADLEASAPVTLPDCLSTISDTLTGRPDDVRPDVFVDTSPARLQPATAWQASVNGALDRIAPPQLGLAYTDLVTAAGGTARYVEVDDAGHVELISPGTQAFEAQADLLEFWLLD